MIEGLPRGMTATDLEREINEQLMQMHNSGELDGPFRMVKLVKLNLAKPYYEFESHFATDNYCCQKE